MKKLNKFLIWLYYNNPKIEVRTASSGIADEFEAATAGKSKKCTCKKDHGRCINIYWNKWHCTYCLKPKENK